MCGVMVSGDVRCVFVFFLMIRRPPRSTPFYSSGASDVYKGPVAPAKTNPTAIRNSRRATFLSCFIQ